MNVIKVFILHKRNMFEFLPHGLKIKDQTQARQKRTNGCDKVQPLVLQNQPLIQTPKTKTDTQSNRERYKKQMKRF